MFPLALLLYFGILTNVALVLLNLIPIPPLDGSKIFTHLLPPKAQEMYDSIGSYGMLLLYIVVLRTHLPQQHLYARAGLLQLDDVPPLICTWEGAGAFRPLNGFQMEGCALAQGRYSYRNRRPSPKGHLQLAAVFVALKPHAPSQMPSSKHRDS